MAAASQPPLGLPSTDGTRNRYVVGIFKEPAEAYAAVSRLDTATCEVLVTSDTDKARAASFGFGHVITRYLDTSATLPSRVAEALSTSAVFAVLGADSAARVGKPHPAGSQALFQNLVHHLATGATVVIVYAPGAEQLLRVSRTLLDAKCDLLLTHDVVQPKQRAFDQPPPDDDCCQSCTTRACERVRLPSGDETAQG